MDAPAAGRWGFRSGGPAACRLGRPGMVLSGERGAWSGLSRLMSWERATWQRQADGRGFLLRSRPLPHQPVDPVARLMTCHHTFSGADLLPACVSSSAQYPEGSRETVDKPDKHGLAFTEPELTTPDGVKLKTYLMTAQGVDVGVMLFFLIHSELVLTPPPPPMR